jgi:proteasome lid subunit RPN8/RPN11
VTQHLILPHKAQLMGAARDAHPFEACGIITREGTVWTLRNRLATVGDRTDDSVLKFEDQFAIHPDDLIVAWPLAAAIWHSHPNGRLDPSDRDTHGHPPFNAHGEPLGMVIVTREDARVIIPW